MEILRLAHPTEIKEQAGPITLPEIIRFSTQNPGRAIDETIRYIEIGDFYDELSSIKSSSKKEKKEVDKAGIYYVNGSDFHPASNNYFSEDPLSNTISIVFDTPQINPQDPTKFLPKEKSVAAIVHYSVSDSLPQPDNLLHLLLEDAHFKAATAAFFLTSKGNLYALFRTSSSPQANRERVAKIIKNMKDVGRQFSDETGIRLSQADSFVLKEAIESYGLRFFHGKLDSKALGLSSPEIHVI